MKKSTISFQNIKYFYLIAKNIWLHLITTQKEHISYSNYHKFHIFQVVLCLKYPIDIYIIALAMIINLLL